MIDFLHRLERAIEQTHRALREQLLVGGDGGLDHPWAGIGGGTREGEQEAGGRDGRCWQGLARGEDRVHR